MSNYIIHAEAACCIWEALLERRNSDATEPDAIEMCFQQRGTNEVRHAAIALSVLCCDVWNAIPESERPDCYDWDFVPHFVDALDWDANLSACVAIPTTEQALALYRECIARRDGVCVVSDPFTDGADFDGSEDAPKEISP